MRYTLHSILHVRNMKTLQKYKWLIIIGGLLFLIAGLITINIVISSANTSSLSDADTQVDDNSVNDQDDNNDEDAEAQTAVKADYSTTTCNYATCSVDIPYLVETDTDGYDLESSDNATFFFSLIQGESAKVEYTELEYTNYQTITVSGSTFSLTIQKVEGSVTEPADEVSGEINTYNFDTVYRARNNEEPSVWYYSYSNELQNDAIECEAGGNDPVTPCIQTTIEGYQIGSNENYYEPLFVTCEAEASQGLSRCDDILVNTDISIYPSNNYTERQIETTGWLSFCARGDENETEDWQNYGDTGNMIDYCLNYPENWRAYPTQNDYFVQGNKHIAQGPFFVRLEENQSCFDYFANECFECLSLEIQSEETKTINGITVYERIEKFNYGDSPSDYLYGFCTEVGGYALTLYSGPETHSSTLDSSLYEQMLLSIELNP